MSRGKTNPRRIPVTQADIKRARKKAETETLDMACAIILMGLLDGGIITEDQMRPAWDAINNKSDSVVKGYCTVSDLKQTLREEYEIYL